MSNLLQTLSKASLLSTSLVDPLVLVSSVPVLCSPPTTAPVVVGRFGELSTLYVDISGSVVVGNDGVAAIIVDMLDLRRDASSVVLFGDTSKGSRRCPRGKAFDIESNAAG